MRAAILIALAIARTASASPELDHVLSVPTAWLPQAGSMAGTAGIDHHGDASVELGAGLGGISEVELAADSETRLVRAAFRLGARENEWFSGQPALVFGVDATIGQVRKANAAYVVASKRVGIMAMHAGAMTTDAVANATRLGLAVRPLFGAELTPPQYPKTTVMADIAWTPHFDPDPKLGFAFMWGVRYQALAWGSIELDVRQREGELGSPTVMVRLNAVVGYAAPRR